MAVAALGEIDNLEVRVRVRVKVRASARVRVAPDMAVAALG